MLTSILWILLTGFFVGQIGRRLGAPPLIGMILVGIILGPQVGNKITPEVLQSADYLRVVAVMIILMKAGLGLDRDKLAQQGTVALRLGILPAATEAIAIALAAMLIFHWDFPTGLLLGCIISAESPAVIVPGMLRLKSLGWGVTKGIPDAILTGSALSNALFLLFFSLLLNFLTHRQANPIILPYGIEINPVFLVPLQIFIQVSCGICIGYGMARLVVSLLTKQNWIQHPVQDILIAASIALFLVISAPRIPIYSGYLAVISLGFFIVQLDAPLGRKLRAGVDSLWVVAEIILFVLLGANIQLEVLGNVWFTGILLLGFGLFCGRTIGWYLSTAGSDWNWRERLFLLPGNSAKATVQAAIGAIPLAAGIKGGDIILAIAALSILTTAPLGAWAIPTFAPKLLEKGEIDPTKVTVTTKMLFLAAVDTSPLAAKVLTKAADLARRSNGEVIVLHVMNGEKEEIAPDLADLAKRLLLDIRYRLVTATGEPATEIIQMAEAHQVTDIIMGKRGDKPGEEAPLGSTSHRVLTASSFPVILVE